MMKKFIPFIIIFLVFPASLYAACVGSSPTWTVASPYDDSDMQDCLNSASDGDTINIPACSVTWNVTVTCTGKELDIVGAGEGVTNITDAVPYVTYKEKLFDFVVSDGEHVRITAMTIDGTAGSDGAIQIGVGSSGGTGTFRIDNITFDDLTDGTSGRAIVTENGITGVIDHCTFNAPLNGSLQAIGVWGCCSGDAHPGDTDWADTSTLGTSDAVFVEDCVFDFEDHNDGPIDAYKGARFVFRYNTVDNSTVGNHGACSTGIGRGALTFEVYENVFFDTYSGETLTRAIQWRGGTGVVYNNDFDTATSAAIVLTYYRSCWVSGCTPYGLCHAYWASQCDGDDPLDGNEDATGWPCADQPGLGANQAKEAIYEWGNEECDNPPCDGLGSDVDWSINDFQGGGCTCTSPGVADHIQLDRDYYNDTSKPAYTAYTYPHPLQDFAAAAITGTITPTATEAEIVTGGKTIIITLTGDTWVATVGADNAITTALIAGIDSGGAEAAGWDAVVKTNMIHGDVVRTSDTVVTITVGAEATYAVTTNETITITIPATALTSASQLVAAPTFEIVATNPAAVLTGTLSDNATEAQIVAGGETIIITVSDDTWVATVGDDNAITTALINGIDSAQSEGAGWDAVVKANMVFGDVTRDSDTQVTVLLGAEATYDISANEAITVVIPTTAVTSVTQITASPVMSIIFFDTATEEILGMTLQ